MESFIVYRRVLHFLFWGKALTLVLALNLSVCAASSGEIKPPSFQFVQDGGIKGYISALNLAAKFPENMEVTEHCLELLRVFGQRYVALVNCLVSSVRPVKICENCYMGYNSFQEIYSNMSSDQTGPGNVSCQDSLIRADRLMLLYNLYQSLTDIWEAAACTKCLSTDEKPIRLSDSMLNFTANLNKSLSCFEKYQGNHTELCTDCKAVYRGLNELYSETNATCIDVVDAMNVTRHLWSKTFNCSVPREETVPVIAVSSFMLFLPVIFYLSNFLHSEQKKRKLIHPKRAKSSNSLMNIQDKFS